MGAMLNGIKPIWASEVEPYPIRVTTKRLPDMKHYGNITEIDGSKVEPVDIISFGSPCTDMSVAGKRAGLAGNQSCLFYEAIRIVKEMREETNGKQPRFIVWENVPGAFSSNKGKDFKAVLDAIIKTTGADAPLPMPEKGKWPYADIIVGRGWSIAYRTIDAQYWGVPQRRRRIYLVADFGSERAGEILFESKSLPGDTSQGIEQGQEIARDIGKGTQETGICILNDQGGSVMDVSEDVVGTLRAQEHGHQPIIFEPGAATILGGHIWKNIARTLRTNMGDNSPVVAYSVENHSADSRVQFSKDGNVQSLTSRMGTGGNNVPLVLNERQRNLNITHGRTGAITVTDYKGAQCIVDNEPLTLKIRSGCTGGGKGPLMQKNKSATLSCNNDQTLFVPFGICSDGSNSMRSANSNSGIYEAGILRTLDSDGGNPSCNQGGIAVVEKTYCMDRASYNQGKNAKFGISIKENKAQTLVAQGPPAVAQPAEYAIRRLTPSECAKLQGFPADWGKNLESVIPKKQEITWWKDVFVTIASINGKVAKPKSDGQIEKWLRNTHSDAAEYKMWGNGVALPCVSFVMGRIKKLWETT